MLDLGKGQNTDLVLGHLGFATGTGGPEPLACVGSSSGCEVDGRLGCIAA
jgi:hypothetical protein